MSGPKLGPSPTYLGFTRDRTPKLRKSAIADLRWLASLAPQGDGLRDISRRSAGPRWISMTSRLKSVAAGLCLRQRACRDEDVVRETMEELGWLRRQASGATFAL